MRILYLLLNPANLLLYMAAQFLSLGPKNDAEVSKLSFEFSWRLQIFLLLCWLRLGLRVVIVNGLRSDAEQAALHKADTRNPATPGDHGAGNAADLNFWKDGKPVLLKASPAAQWLPVYQLAALCGIANGSRFPGYPDNNHFFIRPGSAYYLDLLKLFQS